MDENTQGEPSEQALWATYNRFLLSSSRRSCFARADWGAEPKLPQKAEDRNTPHRKSMLLLYKKIGREKYREFKKMGWFAVQGKHGTYRFSHYWVYLDTEFKMGNKTRPITWSLCIQPLAQNLPEGDAILARYLTFLEDEDKFLETANFENVETKAESQDVHRITDVLYLNHGRWIPVGELENRAVDNAMLITLPILRPDG